VTVAILDARPLARSGRQVGGDAHGPAIRRDQEPLVVRRHVRNDEIGAAVGRSVRDDRRRGKLGPNLGQREIEVVSVPDREVGSREKDDMRVGRIDRERARAVGGAEPSRAERQVVRRRHHVLAPALAAVARKPHPRPHRIDPALGARDAAGRYMPHAIARIEGRRRDLHPLVAAGGAEQDERAGSGIDKLGVVGRLGELADQEKVAGFRRGRDEGPCLSAVSRAVHPAPVRRARVVTGRGKDDVVVGRRDREVVDVGRG
jgi:hypothetical protein